MSLPTPIGRQSHVAYLPPTGHQVVLGTAGTGKTVMAMLRALHLSNPRVSGSGRTLLVTYNNALATYLEHLSPNSTKNLDIRTYGRFARGYLASCGAMQGWGAITKPWERRDLINESVESVSSRYDPHRFFEREVDWFQDEISWITGMGLHDEADYLKAERTGRKTPLNPGLRKVTWEILEEYRNLRTEAGHIYDWDDIAMSVREQLAIDTRPRMYRHIVIDEGQDLSPERIRSLSEAADPYGSVTFFGDYAQQIYGQGMSWRACGLRVRQVETFRDNYRNSTTIAEVAMALSSMPFFGKTDDLVPPVAPKAGGPKPTLVECSDESEEISVVQAAAKRFGSVGRVGVLARTWNDADRACRGLDSRRLDPDMNTWDPSPGIYRTTYHSAKGLEFDTVIMPFCSSDVIPLSDVVDALGESDADERESKLLYVAITRAKSDLLLTFSGEKTHLLPDAPGLFAEVKP